MCHEHAFGAAEDDPFPADACDFAVEGLGPGECDVRASERRSVRPHMLMQQARRRHRGLRRVKSEEQSSEEQRKKDEWSGDVANYFSQSHLISSFHLSTPFSTHNGPRRLPRGSASRHTPLSPCTPLSPLLLTLPRPQLCRPLRQGTRRVRRDQLQLTDTCHRRVFRRPVPRLSLDDYRRTPSVQTYCDTENAPRSMPFSQPSYR